MGKFLGVVALTVIVPVVGLASLVAAIGGGPGTPSAATSSGGSPTPAQASPALTTGWTALDSSAAATCPGLPWSVLAAIGAVESDSGRSTAPGVDSGANAAGAEGPMQFEPATFAAYATVGPGGASPPDPYDPVDAVYTAAAMLCADGGGRAATLRSAVLDYNHSTPYVDTVLVLSIAFAADPTVDGTVVTALSFAAEQLGTPYVWGGTGPDGFDCSGLAQAAYGAAGVRLPRVAQDQYDAGPAVPDGATVLPGDLVFFGTGPTGVDHVGIYVGSGLMVDAPHTGAVVRVEPAEWGGFVGATRPA
ncbi:MAG: NlpC/P60 family protein [Acidimicrobiales bacterium]